MADEEIVESQAAVESEAEKEEQESQIVPAKVHDEAAQAFDLECISKVGWQANEVEESN